MGIADLRDFVGDWELAVDLPGAEGIRGHVLFETMGEIQTSLRWTSSSATSAASVTTGRRLTASGKHPPMGRNGAETLG